jgi:hypothetical protein
MGEKAMRRKEVKVEVVEEKKEDEEEVEEKRNT